MSDDGNSSRAGDRPAVEWIVGGVSAVLVACIAAFLAYQAAFGDSVPPRLSVSVDRFEQVSNGTLVEVVVRNDGDRTAAGVVAQVAMADGQGQTIRKTIRFDYVPGHATRRGAFLLDDPQLSRAEVRPSIDGFTEP